MAVRAQGDTVLKWRECNESEEDRQRQATAALFIERRWHCVVEDLSPFLYEIDWCLRRDDRICAFAEYKYRDRQYPEMMLSLAKWAKLRQLGWTARVPALMIYQFEDGSMMYFDAVSYLHVKELKVLWGGNDRGQNGDKEPVIMLPLKDMKPVKSIDPGK